MPLLSEAEVKHSLEAVKDWRLVRGEIVREFSFSDFAAAMQFVNRVANKAESAGHHPDIDIRYNRVRLALTSHDAGGLTNRDFDLASSIDALA